MEKSLLGKKLTDEEKLVTLLSSVRAGFDELREYEVRIRNTRKRLAAQVQHIELLLSQYSK